MYVRCIYCLFYAKIFNEIGSSQGKCEKRGVLSDSDIDNKEENKVIEKTIESKKTRRK